jgi:hypothetical protein
MSDETIRKINAVSTAAVRKMFDELRAEQEPFYALVDKSPFTALMHVHEAIRKDKAHWTLAERDESCGQVLAAAYSLVPVRSK